MENERILIGEIVKPQGIKGEVKIKAYSVSVDDLKKDMFVFVGESQEQYTLTNFSVRQGFLFAKFAEISSIAEAERLRNKLVYLNKTDIRQLEEDEFLIEEMIGCRVELSDGRELGVLEDVQNFGSADVFYVRTTQNKQILFPNVDDIFDSIDLSKEIIIVNAKKYGEVGVE